MSEWLETLWLSLPRLVRFACAVLLLFIGIQVIGVIRTSVTAYPIYYVIGCGLVSASAVLALFIVHIRRYVRSVAGADLESDESQAAAPPKRASLASWILLLLVLTLLAVGSWNANAWFTIGEGVTRRSIMETLGLFALLIAIVPGAPLALLLLAVLVDALLPTVRRCARVEFSVSENPEDMLQERAQLERITFYDEGFGQPVPAEPRDGTAYTVEATRGLIRGIVKSVRIVIQQRSPSKVVFLCTAQRGYEAHVSLELNGNSLLCYMDVRTSLRLQKLITRVMGQQTYARYLAVGEANRIAQCGDCEVRILSVTPSC